MIPTVSITPETVISTEGDTFAWDFTLDQPVPSGGLTLSLPITQNNDPAPGDVIYNVEGSTGITDFDFIVEDNISIGFSVTLEEGVTSATLVSEAVVDDNDIEEAADEIFTTVLADGVDYRANPDSNEVQTFITGQTVVSFTPEQVNIAEGETFAWNFSLNQPAPEGGLTLSLPITFNNDPEPGDVDYNVNGSTNITDFNFLVIDDISVGFNVTIAEGATEATLVSQAVADDIEEGDEIFTTVLNDGANYRANPLNKEVVTTIVETSTSGSAIAIENPGFEIPQLPENQFTQTSLGEFIPGWKVFDPDALIGENITDVGAYNPIANVFPSEAPEGENTGYAYSQAPIGSGVFGLTQTLDTQLKANTKYTLQVEVGNAAENDPDDGFNYEGFPGYRVELLVGGKVIARDDNSLSIAEGEFETSTVTFTSTETEPFLGQNLEIRLVNLLNSTGEDVEFDNVRLFGQTVDNPVVKQISGTPEDDNLFGTNAAEKISGGRGDDDIFGNGGMDTLMGGRGDDDIYGSSDAETIEGGRGDDIIYANGGNDLINSGFGLDTVYLGTGEATVILDKGEGFDTIFNFQLGATKLEVSSLDNLNFTDSASGAEIFLEDDLLAVVAGQSAHIFSSNKDMIFAV